MHILLVEDDAALAQGLTLAMRDGGHTVQCVDSLADALRALSLADVIITDVRLPDGDAAGIDLVRETRRHHPGVEVLVMTGYGTIPQAVEAMRCGARTYLNKPFENDVLLEHLREIEELRGLSAEIHGRGGLIGRSKAMQAVYLQIDIAATTDLPVLIQGETGCGKELAARAIHDQSKRKQRPFIAVNCAALPRELAESALFGQHVDGASTHPIAGRFQLADGGTIFLDEINALPAHLQSKLLRTLESSEIRPVGPDTSGVKIDARIITAATADLEIEAVAGRFRQDLFFRLNVLPVTLPTLRERPEDIPLIMTMVLERLRAENGCAIELDAGAQSALVTHRWPGNVREMISALQRAVIVACAANPSAGGALLITARHLGLPGDHHPKSFREAQEQANAEWSRRTIEAALTHTTGNVAEAARLLQMDRTVLYRHMRRLGITPDAQRESRG